MIPFLTSLHHLLDNVAHHDYNINHHVDVAQHTSLHDASSPYRKLPGTSVPNPREGIPNVLLTTRTDPPFHMFLYPPDLDHYISRRIIQHGVYEAMTTKLVTNSLPLLTLPSTLASSCDINFVLDMGSNLGYYSLLAASRGYNVVSFEASPDTAWLQQSSAALNGFSTNDNNSKSRGSLLLINKGVSDIPSTGRMARHANSPGMTSFASTTEFDLKPGTNGSALDVNIELVRAGDVLAELGLQNNGNGGDTTNICYKLLKIDVEGFELKALHGLGNLTTTYPFEIIVMEYFPSMLKAAGAADPMDVLRYIAMQGYQFYIIENSSLKKVEDLENDDRVRKVDGSGDHINLMAKRVV